MQLVPANGPRGHGRRRAVVDEFRAVLRIGDGLVAAGRRRTSDLMVWPLPWALESDREVHGVRAVREGRTTHRQRPKSGVSTGSRGVRQTPATRAKRAGRRLRLGRHRGGTRSMHSSAAQAAVAPLQSSQAACPQLGPRGFDCPWISFLRRRRAEESMCEIREHEATAERIASRDQPAECRASRPSDRTAPEQCEPRAGLIRTLRWWCPGRVPPRPGRRQTPAIQMQHGRA